MSKLEELIQELCPDGVEYVELSELLVKTSSGLNPRNNFKLNTNDAKNYYVTVKEIVSGSIVFSDKTDLINDEAMSVIQNRSNLEVDDVLLSGIGTIGKVALVDIPIDNWNCSESVILLKPKKEIILPKYLKYILESGSVQEYFNKKATGSTLKGIRQKDLQKLRVPLAPLPIQREIVHILDNFTLLSAELSAELSARKQQYAYYRDYLLDFSLDEDIEHLKSTNLNVDNLCLENVLKIKNGKDYKTYNAGDIPVYGSGGVMTHIDTYAYDKPSVLIPRKGSIDKLYYVDTPFWTVDTIFYTEIDENVVIPKYVYYWLQKEHLEKLNTAGGVPSLTQAVLNKVKIVVPSLEEQKRIVSILDRFDKLCNDISIGLPAEIEKRKQQYEYYRDAILSFDCSQIVKVERERELTRSKAIKWCELGDVALVTKLAGFEFTEYVTYSDSGNIIALRGLNVKNGHLDLSDVKYIDNSNLDKLNRSKLVIGDMLFTYVGTVGQVALIDKDDKYYLAPNVALIRIKNKQQILPSYLKHYFQSNWIVTNQINKLLQSSSMKNIPMEKIRKFKIPVPSLEEQEQIVSILDRFDKLCNDISEGIPAEIEARQKQYEYYRDKLLTFKIKEN